MRVVGSARRTAGFLIGKPSVGGRCRTTSPTTPDADRHHERGQSSEIRPTKSPMKIPGRAAAHRQRKRQHVIRDRPSRVSADFSIFLTKSFRFVLSLFVRVRVFAPEIYADGYEFQYSPAFTMRSSYVDATHIIKAT
jgi:hypothetical protein